MSGTRLLNRRRHGLTPYPPQHDADCDHNPTKNLKESKPFGEDHHGDESAEEGLKVRPERSLCGAHAVYGDKPEIRGRNEHENDVGKGGPRKRVEPCPVETGDLGTRDQQ